MKRCRVHCNKKQKYNMKALINVSWKLTLEQHATVWLWNRNIARNSML